MPSLFRFLLIVGFLAAATYAGIAWLAYFVPSQPREMTVTIPPDKFIKNR
jgi:hypothetical protein